MKIEYVNDMHKFQDMDAGDISVGVVFYATGFNCLLRVYDGVVNIEDPNQTWRPARGVKFRNVSYLKAKVVVE